MIAAAVRVAAVSRTIGPDAELGARGETERGSSANRRACKDGEGPDSCASEECPAVGPDSAPKQQALDRPRLPVACLGFECAHELPPNCYEVGIGGMRSGRDESLLLVNSSLDDQAAQIACVTDDTTGPNEA